MLNAAKLLRLRRELPTEGRVASRLPLKPQAELSLFLLTALTALLGGALIWRKRNTAIAWLTNLVELSKEPAYLFGGLRIPEELFMYIKKHRSDVALVRYSVETSDAGEVAEPRISHNADEPMPLASTMKIVVLAAYAREVVAGRLNPKEMVPVQDWEKFYLPGTDGGAHAEAMRVLGFSDHPAGRLVETGATVELDRIVWSMISESDNAATDYILDRVGDRAVDAVIRGAGLWGQDPIRLILGEELAFSNHEHPALTDEKLEELLSLSPSQYKRRTEHLARMYAETQWGERERDSDGIGGSPRNWLSAFRYLTPKGTASDYARVMAGVVREDFFSSEVSRIMRRHLEWPMQDPANREQFQAVGVKGGSLPGILTYAWYMIPKTGDFAGKPIIVTLFIRDMSLSAWTRLSKTYAQQEFIKRLALDESFARSVEKEI